MWNTSICYLNDNPRNGAIKREWTPSLKKKIPVETKDLHCLLDKAVPEVTESGKLSASIHTVHKTKIGEPESVARPGQSQRGVQAKPSEGMKGCDSLVELLLGL